MARTNVVVSISVLVIFTLFVYMYISDSGSTTAHEFVDKKDVDLVVKAIINDLENEANEAIPARFKGNVKNLRLTKEEKGKLLLLLESRVQSTPLGSQSTDNDFPQLSAHVPGMHNSAIHPKLDFDRKRIIDSLRAITATITNITKALEAHESGKKTRSAATVKSLTSRLGDLQKRHASVKKNLVNIVARVKTSNNSRGGKVVTIDEDPEAYHQLTHHMVVKMGNIGDAILTRPGMESVAMTTLISIMHFVSTRSDKELEHELVEVITMKKLNNLYKGKAVDIDFATIGLENAPLEQTSTEKLMLVLSKMNFVTADHPLFNHILRIEAIVKERAATDAKEAQDLVDAFTEAYEMVLSISGLSRGDWNNVSKVRALPVTVLRDVKSYVEDNGPDTIRDVIDMHITTRTLMDIGESVGLNLIEFEYTRENLEKLDLLTLTKIEALFLSSPASPLYSHITDSLPTIMAVIEEMTSQKVESEIVEEQYREAMVESSAIDVEVNRVENDDATANAIRKNKTGLVKATITEKDGAIAVRLIVPSDLSPGEEDVIPLFVSSEGRKAIDDYATIHKKIRSDGSLDNLTVEEKDTISSAGLEFNKIKGDYVRQRKTKIQSRGNALSEAL